MSNGGKGETPVKEQYTLIGPSENSRPATPISLTR